MGFEDWFLCGCPHSTTEDYQLQQDYFKNITPLYHGIENHQWASVNNFIKTGYWKNSFFPDPLRPEIQAKTWMVRYEIVTLDEKPVNKSTNICLPKERKEKVTWKQLPMHAAIIYSAPAIIVQKLIKLYPEALKSADNRGNLPIHLAFRHGSNDAVLALLLQEYPEGMNCREINGLLPTECATELATSQPLRGALLKTSMSKDEKDRQQYIQEKVKAERLYFDDRSATPFQGNLSAQKATPASEEQKKLEALTQEMENLRYSVSQVLSKQESITSPAHASEALAQRSPSFANGQEATPSRPSTKLPVSPTAMESLQEMVSRTLAGASVMEALSPKNEESMLDPPINTPNRGSAMEALNPKHSLLDPPINTINSPTETEPALSMVNSILESPIAHQALPMQPTSTSNILNPLGQRASQPTAIPPILRNLSYNSMQHQHQQHQQKLEQLHQQQQQVNQSLRHTATFEEQQKRLDKEVRQMEEKMLQMELAMKEMHIREKTVRRELALTLKEVKHWKAQAKRAATEEEKNRVLTEMLHELVPSAVTPRKHNKTPTAASTPNDRSDDDDLPRQKSKVDPDEQKHDKHRYRPTSMRKTQSEQSGHRRHQFSQADERRQFQRDDDLDDDRANLREYPPKSNRHSDVGAYRQETGEGLHDLDFRTKGHRGRPDAPPAVPLRRIQSDYHKRDRRGRTGGDAAFEEQAYPPHHNMDRRKPHSERNMSHGGSRWMEPSAIRVDQRDDRGRFADPHGAHVESGSYVPSYNGTTWQIEGENDEVSGDFSESLVDRIANLQARKKNEKYQTRNYKRAEKLVQQRRQDAQEHGVWQSRDPEDSKHVSYHRRAKQHMQRMMNSSVNSNTTSASASTGIIARNDYFHVPE